MAIAFTLTKDWIKSTIIGATTMNHLKINIDAIDIELSKECLDDIHKIYQQYPVPF
jgi:aryl-alcohol dehydrogenase-like predicted oxidoreductase